MSSDWIVELEPEPSEPETTVVVAEGFPAPLHPAESDYFARHRDVPGHIQEALEAARITLVGAGGLGSWVALALARSGARSLTIIEPDVFERHNASRQLMYAKDLARSKAIAVAYNIAPHMPSAGTITAIRLPFTEAVQKYAVGSDVLITLVDNNATRLEVARHARHATVPALFGMMSRDSMRFQVFLQEATKDASCLLCALPNLDPESVTPCAAATIATCMTVAGRVTFFAYRALMGWPQGLEPLNWHEADLLGRVDDRTSFVRQRHDCSFCNDPSNVVTISKP